MFKVFIILSILVVPNMQGNVDETSKIDIGQTWSLEKRSNKSSIGDSEVLYFFSNDAYNTYQARRFSDWDRFSIIDGRNLVRLNTGDRVEILKSKYQSKIYEVKLLDGFQKNRRYFLIKEDLINDFRLME
ncbi:MAG: hypothetical protein EVA97_03475 [SAR86 cluster bacterium]|uniref:Uncharacterized protein n=1 Tax=SAR86 cluster bacterium TaxID=2030880 RepID=A0A520N381_9GAMM|nr:MAG: hypothetical protein EVA97_03475 [SAR86 cluster bacterium]